MISKRVAYSWVTAASVVVALACAGGGGTGPSGPGTFHGSCDHLGDKTVTLGVHYTCAYDDNGKLRWRED